MNAATDADIDYVEAYASAAEWFATQVARTNTRTPVPSCPGWTVLDLVTHLGNIHAWAATVMETGKASRRLEDRPSSNKPKRVAEWYLAKAEDLYAVLRDTPAEQECWNFVFGAGSASFWQRRQTHETLLHGVDLALATGVAERLPADLAADGVDETLTVMLHRMHSRGHAADLSAPIALRASDVDRCWVVEPPMPGGIPAQASAVEGRARGRSPLRVTKGFRLDTDQVQASSALLLKVLWRRASPSDRGVALHGDTERIHRFLESRLTP